MSNPLFSHLRGSLQNTTDPAPNGEYDPALLLTRLLSLRLLEQGQAQHLGDRILRLGRHYLLVTRLHTRVTEIQDQSVLRTHTHTHNSRVSLVNARHLCRVYLQRLRLLQTDIESNLRDKRAHISDDDCP